MSITCTCFVIGCSRNVTTHLKKTERSYNSREITLLRRHKYSFWQHCENFGLKWVFATSALITPLLLYEKFIQDIPSKIELPVVIALQIIGIIIVLVIMKRWGEIDMNIDIENEIKNGKAQVFRVKTDKAFKREDLGDFGSGFYLKIDNNKTLFLQGQHLDEFQDLRKFPNSEFEMIRTKLFANDIVDMNFFGEYLEPEKKLEPFSEERYGVGDIHFHGDILETSIENIK